MPIRELREKFGKGKPGEVLRRAVRAECPGGGIVLDALALAARNQTKSADWRQIYDYLIDVRNAMTNDVARRYEFKTATPLEDEKENEKTN